MTTPEGAGMCTFTPMTDTATTPDALLTPGEAARQLGITLKTLRLWDAAGRITVGRTPGGHRRVRQSEIDRIRAESAG